MTNERRQLAAGALNDWLSSLGERYAVFAPQLGKRSIEFAPLSAPDDVRLSVPSSKLPVKRFFFPQSETLLRYDFAKQGRDRVQATVPEDRPVLLYGARPCDARSLAILDEVFLKQEGVRDPYYAARRANTTVVAVACNDPAGACFCASVEGGPHDTAGADLLLRDAGDGWMIVEVVTDKGAVALEGAATTDASPELIDAVESRKADAQSAATIETEPRELADRLMSIFDDDVWDRVADNCLGCGTCAYLCPTCHCFDIQDERLGEEGRRVRNWDACMFGQFTLHASGHNPRPSLRERWRQRAMHKFCYYPNKFGPIACVGCGRCVRDCPTGVDIRRILKTLEEAVASHV